MVQDNKSTLDAWQEIKFDMETVTVAAFDKMNNQAATSIHPTQLLKISRVEVIHE